MTAGANLLRKSVAPDGKSGLNFLNPTRPPMKTHLIEVHKIKAMSNSQNMIRARIDALVQPMSVSDEGGLPTSVLEFTEGTARVLLLLLKTQLAEFDGRKAKSRR
jgi:hypothetical protein